MSSLTGAIIACIIVVIVCIMAVIIQPKDEENALEDARNLEYKIKILQELLGEE